MPRGVHGPSEIFADHGISTMTEMNVISASPDSALFRYGLGEIIVIETTFNRCMLVTGSGEVKTDLAVGDSVRAADVPSRIRYEKAGVPSRSDRDGRGHRRDPRTRDSLAG